MPGITEILIIAGGSVGALLSKDKVKGFLIGAILALVLTLVFAYFMGNAISDF